MDEGFELEDFDKAITETTVVSYIKANIRDILADPATAKQSIETIVNDFGRLFVDQIWVHTTDDIQLNRWSDLARFRGIADHNIAATIEGIRADPQLREEDQDDLRAMVSIDTTAPFEALLPGKDYDRLVKYIRETVDRTWKRKT